MSIFNMTKEQKTAGLVGVAAGVGTTLLAQTIFGGSPEKVGQAALDKPWPAWVTVLIIVGIIALIGFIIWLVSRK